MLILCATDLERKSDVAIARARRLRRRLRARLALLHVVTPEGGRRDSAERLQQAKNALTMRSRAARGTFEPLVRRGAAAKIVLEVARQRSARLVVIGPHRRAALLDALRGTFTERLLRNAHCPVLIVRRTPARDYGNVLLALDGSRSARHVVAAAESLVPQAGANRSVVHAHEPPYEAMMGSVGVRDDSVARYVAASMDQAGAMIRDELRASSPNPGRYRVRVIDSRPGPAIRRALRVLDPDLLVLGSRGLGRIRRAFLGSTAFDALKAAKCDVLVVPEAMVRAARRARAI